MFKSKSLIVNIFLPTIRFPKFAPKIPKSTFLYFHMIANIIHIPIEQNVTQFLIVIFHENCHFGDKYNFQNFF